MAHGFYSASLGAYWETSDYPPDSIMAGYPEDAGEIPLRPSTDHVWVPEIEAWALEPAAAPVPLTISRPKLILGLMADGFISAEEAETWSSGTTLPVFVLDAIDTLPASPTTIRVAARVFLRTATEIERAHFLIERAGALAWPELDTAALKEALDTKFVAWDAIVLEEPS